MTRKYCSIHTWKTIVSYLNCEAEDATEEEAEVAEVAEVAEAVPEPEPEAEEEGKEIFCFIFALHGHWISVAKSKKKHSLHVMHAMRTILWLWLIGALFS